MKLFNNKIIYIATTAFLLASLSACGKEVATEEAIQVAEQTTEDTQTEEPTTVESTTETKPEEKQPKVYEELPQVAQEDVPQFEGYNLLWNDEFNGDTLDMETWRYEKHAPGWVNAELQEYTDSTDNVFVKDGRLMIKALKTQTKVGKDYYTSGKIMTRGLKDFMYGKVIARAKVPEGQGLWPAFWMMPSKESIYGSWPGDPDETTDFDNAEFEVDYVRVYQKPGYDMNVTKPEPVF